VEAAAQEVSAPNHVEARLCENVEHDLQALNVLPASTAAPLPEQDQEWLSLLIGAGCAGGGRGSGSDASSTSRLHFEGPAPRNFATNCGQGLDTTALGRDVLWPTAGAEISLPFPPDLGLQRGLEKVSLLPLSCGLHESLTQSVGAPTGWLMTHSNSGLEGGLWPWRPGMESFGLLFSMCAQNDASLASASSASATTAQAANPHSIREVR
jgi:hypothetical protein